MGKRVEPVYSVQCKDFHGELTRMKVIHTKKQEEVKPVFVSLEELQLIELGEEEDECDENGDPIDVCKFLDENMRQ